jgi:NADH:ubiquinone oxidoreductase subunit H
VKNDNRERSCTDYPYLIATGENVANRGQRCKRPHGYPVNLAYSAVASMNFVRTACYWNSKPPLTVPEAESELVAGFFTEHSAVAFACFFLGEYTNIIVIDISLSLCCFTLSIHAVIVIVGIDLDCWPLS